MVSVAQRSEHWTVAPGVGGSSPLTHPKQGLRYAPVAQWIRASASEAVCPGSSPGGGIPLHSPHMTQCIMLFA